MDRMFSLSLCSSPFWRLVLDRNKPENFSRRLQILRRVDKAVVQNIANDFNVAATVLATLDMQLKTVDLINMIATLHCMY